MSKFRTAEEMKQIREERKCIELCQGVENGKVYPVPCEHCKANGYKCSKYGLHSRQKEEACHLCYINAITCVLRKPDPELLYIPCDYNPDCSGHIPRPPPPVTPKASRKRKASPQPEETRSHKKRVRQEPLDVSYPTQFGGAGQHWAQAQVFPGTFDNPYQGPPVTPYPYTNNVGDVHQAAYSLTSVGPPSAAWAPPTYGTPAATNIRLSPNTMPNMFQNTFNQANAYDPTGCGQQLRRRSVSAPPCLRGCLNLSLPMKKNFREHGPAISTPANHTMPSTPFHQSMSINPNRALTTDGPARLNPQPDDVAAQTPDSLPQFDDIDWDNIDWSGVDWNGFDWDAWNSNTFGSSAGHQTQVEPPTTTTTAATSAATQQAPASSPMTSPLSMSIQYPPPPDPLVATSRTPPTTTTTEAANITPQRSDHHSQPDLSPGSSPTPITANPVAGASRPDDDWQYDFLGLTNLDSESDFENMRA